MKNFKNIFLLVIVATIFSCSTKKDTLVSRKFHALTTKYNVLYNGNLAFNDGLKEINQNHKDNFWKQLLIEPITFEENKTILTTFSGNPTLEEKELTTFEKAEEKAVKAIQKHSMNFYGREKNTQIDEAYLLLGKSRYYTQRFIPAIEAFNYIIINYPYANVIDETRIWRAKTNIRLDNEKLAIESLKIVLANDKVSETIKEKAHTALAMAYLKTDSIQHVIDQLKLATQTHEDISQTARNLFVLGQIYVSENKKDSAAIVFQKLINFKKAPYKFKIHSTIQLARAASNDSVVSSLIPKFYTLIKDRENRKYRDILYYQAGSLEEERDSINKAIALYQKSVFAEGEDEYQKTFSYERLGNIFFNKADFVLAGTYYDSVLQISNNSTERRIRKIKRKYKGLAKLIRFENILKENDSILTLTSMSKEVRKTFFKNHIETLKEADKKRAQTQLENLTFGDSFGRTSSKQTAKKGKWYFYNPQSLSYGKAEFLKVWGNRPLVDNWRTSENQQISTSNNAIKPTEIIASKYEISAYLKTFPKSTIVVDSLKFGRNEALYQTGLIYKEQFKNAKLAIKRLERLLTFNPEKESVLPIHYHLYQLFKALKNQKAAIHKKIIIEQYPTSQYALIVQNKKAATQEEALTEVQEVYKEIFYLYKEHNYRDVVSQITEYVPTIPESNIIAKFELLKALAIGKYQQKEKYKKALEHVSLKYGNTEEGKRAKEIIKQLN